MRILIDKLFTRRNVIKLLGVGACFLFIHIGVQCDKRSLNEDADTVSSARGEYSVESLIKLEKEVFSLL